MDGQPWLLNEKYGRNIPFSGQWNKNGSHMGIPAMTESWKIWSHDDVIKWKHFPRNWPFVRGIHRSLVDSLSKPVTSSFDVFCDPRLNKRWSKPSRRRWFETPLCSLWRHCNESLQAINTTTQTKHIKPMRKLESRNILRTMRSTKSVSTPQPLTNTIQYYRPLDTPWWRHQWKNFLRYWPLVRGIHRCRWSPRTKASDAELWCFLWYAPE